MLNLLLSRYAVAMMGMTFLVVQAFPPNRHGRTHDDDDIHDDPSLESHDLTDLKARGTAPTDAVSQLLAIAPSSCTCVDAPVPSECTVTTASLAEIIIASFGRHSVTTGLEQAALLSWMAFESAEWKYNRNHFPAPGRPGQGTRVMMMPNYVAEFAQSFEALTDEVTAASGDPDRTLDLVLDDEYSFTAAAWYYDTQCTQEVKEELKTGGEKGWEEFVKGCVGTTVTEDRKEYWVKACEALNIVV